MVSPMWVRILRRPAPRAIWVAVAVAAIIAFGLAWWSFAFPLTYCDSDGWAQEYLEKLPHPPFWMPRARGWPVRAYFNLLGSLSMWGHTPNLIGFWQAASMAVALLWLSAGFVRRATFAELILAPAVVFSSARYAVHSQTILSEPLVLVLSIPVWLALFDDHIGWRRGVLLGMVMGLLLGARIDTAYLLPLLLARFLWLREAHRLRTLAVAVGSMAAVLVAVTALEEPLQPGQHPIGKVMVLAEWMRYTQSPQNPLAKMLEFDLVDRFVPLAQSLRRRDIYGGLGDAVKVYHTYPALGWGAVARLVAYECANQPWAVFTDRLRALADLYATGYAWAWPEYTPWSNLYVPHSWMVANWNAEALDRPDSQCPLFASGQERFYHRTRMRSLSSFRALQFFHQLARPYAMLVLRPMMWLALPVCGVLLWWRRDATYAWLTAIIVAHLGLRGLLIGVDERYQLPVDLLMIWWLALTVRQLTSTASAEARR